MNLYYQLNIMQKINIKQYAINIYGKHWHTLKPNFLNKLNELHINFILSHFN